MPTFDLQCGIFHGFLQFTPNIMLVRGKERQVRSPDGVPETLDTSLVSERHLYVTHLHVHVKSLWSWEIWKMGNRKKNVGMSEQTFSGRMEEIWGQSVAWRLRYVRKRCSSRTKTSRAHHFLSWTSHFRPCVFWTVRTPDLHRATRNDGPG